MDRHPSPTPKTAALRALLASPELEFLMEAHNGLSARIVEEAGFKGIWASGLTLSAQFGVRDNNEASWTQIVDMVEFMADATRIPILMDGDTGYGDFNSMRRLVKKLESRGIAGVCIEDKLFPKMNSLIEGPRQPLADVAEFQGKIRAGKDSQSDPDFVIVARVEALIAGWGLGEALRRAEAYHAAGADAILIHSRKSRADEILAFAREWAGRSPLLIVPTTYYSTPTDVFRAAGVSVLIWANHTLRAAISAMQALARELHATETLVNVEDRIAPVSEIFRLQRADELLAAQRQYAAPRERTTAAVVLAASRGEGLRELTEDRPKAMLPVAGRPLLRRLVDEFKKQGIDAVTVVAGYQARSIDLPDIEVVENPGHAESGELASLACARKAIGEDTVVSYGDLLFRSYILRDLLESAGELVVVVDSSPIPEKRGQQRDLAYCSAPDDHALFPQDVKLLRVDAQPRPEADAPSGRWIGMLRVRGRGRSWLLQALDALAQRPDFCRLGLPDLLNCLIAMGHPIQVLYVSGHWLDVNDPEDLRRAVDFAYGNPALPGSREAVP
ncbi:phosphoenolpyruvate mutase [Pelomicrobium sp.]|jgi:phosphoenolpyruvate phosphomutase|uniref:phosphoenolpyruvate mutase n=1 Tax=Pelomicrobium sp. TaxID=2815319 RepID=UPI002FDE46B2